MLRLGGRIINKRPMLLPALCLALGITFGFYFKEISLYVISAIVCIVLVILFFGPFNALKARFGAYLHWLAGAVFLFTGALLCFFAFSIDYIEPGDGLTVTGIVYSEPYYNGYNHSVFYIEAARVNGQRCGNIKVCLQEETPVAIGDVIMAKADVKIPPGVRNPGGFDEKLNLLSRGVIYKAYSKDAKVIGEKTSLSVVMANTRAFLCNTIDNIFEPDVAPLVRAMLTGDKSEIDDNTALAFKDSGMAHVLAVSGLHAGILIAAVYALFSLLRFGRKQKTAAALLFIAAYAFATGLTTSIVRASIMAAVIIIGRYSGRRTDALNSLSLAFIISLLINPLDLFSAGFMLSFGAVFGLLTVSWQLERILKTKLPQTLAKSVSASIGATVGTLPITASVFNRISVVGAIANVLILPLCSLAIVLSFGTVVLGLIIGNTAQYFGYVAAFVIRLLSGAISAVGVLPFAAINVATPAWYAVICCFIIYFIFSKYVLIKIKTKLIACAAITTVVAIAMLFAAYPQMYIVFLDVGQADAVFIRTYQGRQFFVDGGKANAEVQNFTIRQGIVPNAAFVTHTDSDHFSGIVQLYEEGLLNKVYCSRQEHIRVSNAMPNAKVVPLSAGDSVQLDDFTKAVVLYPYSETEAQGNEASLVLRIEYADYNILLTGDISGQTETQLFCGHDKVDIYKAAHHGSKTSSFGQPLSVVSPRYSVISVGANPYGHPNVVAVQNLADYSGEVFITQHDYAVEFFIDKTIRVNTYRKRKDDT